MLSVSASILIATTITIFRPLELALGNWGQLSSGLSELIIVLIEPFAILSLALIFFSGALLLILRDRAIAILLSVSIGLWLQSTLLVWDYGVFDGSAIDWVAHSGKGVIELFIWVTLIATAIFRPKKIVRHAGTVIAGLLSLQILSLISTYLLVAPLPQKTQPVEIVPEKSAQLIEIDLDQSVQSQQRSIENFLSFSKKTNVIVIVLDTFQSDFFAQSLQTSDLAKIVPAGFTYYRNAASHYPGTFLNLSSILTSRTPEKGASPASIRTVMLESAPSRLKNLGWDSSVLSMAPHYLGCLRSGFNFDCHSPGNLISILAGEAPSTWQNANDARMMLRIAAFRLTPHYLKPWLYNNGKWRVADPFEDETTLTPLDPRIWIASRRDIDILRRLTNDATVQQSRPTFKFLHFFGVHHPSSINEHCEWNGIDNPNYDPKEILKSGWRNRQVAVDASICMMTLLFELFHALETLEVYDNSLIFIVGDHGRTFTHVNTNYAVPEIAGMQQYGNPADRKGKWSLKHPTKGVPLFLVKRPGDRFKLKTSDLPVSLCDIPKTIFNELGLPNEHDFGCESLGSIREGRIAPRRHFRSRDPRKSVEKVPTDEPYEEYIVDGHSWFNESWKKKSELTETGALEN